LVVELPPVLDASVVGQPHSLVQRAARVARELCCLGELRTDRASSVIVGYVSVRILLLVDVWAHLLERRDCVLVDGL
jgi:hypothetical protein